MGRIKEMAVAIVDICDKRWLQSAQPSHIHSLNVFAAQATWKQKSRLTDILR
jgi:hypothetical protein